MNAPVNLEAWRRQSRALVTFSRAELSAILQLYSERVARGEWRDYAIDHGQGAALFSIFRHTADRPLFTLAKIATRPGSPARWELYEMGHRKARGETLAEMLEPLRRRPGLVPR